MASKMKVLFVDDEEDILLIMQDFFEDSYDVYTALSAKEAIEIKNREKIQVIFSDLSMPVMSGIELCREIRKTDKVSIICAFTGKSGIFQLFDIRDAGFDDYFLKPFKMDEIEKAVQASIYKIERWFLPEKQK